MDHEIGTVGGFVLVTSGTRPHGGEYHWRGCRMRKRVPAHQRAAQIVARPQRRKRLRRRIVDHLALDVGTGDHPFQQHAPARGANGVARVHARICDHEVSVAYSRESKSSPAWLIAVTSL